MTDEQRPTRLRFGAFELDADRGELRKSGMEIHLQAQPLRLLALLASHAGEIVSRETIQQHVWPTDTHVEFDQGINACIKQIRGALGDSADHPRFIQTIPRQGYRFVAPVEPLGAADATPLSRWTRQWGVAAAAAVVVPLVVVAVVAFGRGRTAHESADAERPVLAVLPFELFGTEDADAHFADALTEELIAQLGRQYGSRLSVIARTSVMKYKETTKGIDEVGRELGAGYVLEGSVRRVDGRVRVVAQLIRASDQSHVWASAFQRDTENLLDLQVELGETISRGLALKLVPDAVSTSGATSPEVYDLYLRGRHAFRSGEWRAGRLDLERAVELDPGFAPAWVALAELYRQLPPEHEALPLAREALDRALALDDELPEAYFVLAGMRFYRDFDLEGTRAAYERAIELNPAYAEAHHSLASYYSVTGRHEEAVASVQRARRLDPLSSMVNGDVGWYYYFGRRFDEAVEHSQRTLVLDPDFYWAKFCTQLAYLQQRDWEAAVENARVLMEEGEASSEALEGLSDPDPEQAIRAYWRWHLEELRSLSKEQYISPAWLAQLHMTLGEHEAALEGLEAAFEARTGWILPFLPVDPLFDPVREDPRFRDLVARIAE